MSEDVLKSGIDLLFLPKLGMGRGETHTHGYHEGLNPKPLRSTTKA